MEGGAGASIEEEEASSDGQEGEGRSSFSMGEYGVLVWSKRREEGT